MATPTQIDPTKLMFSMMPGGPMDSVINTSKSGQHLEQTRTGQDVQFFEPEGMAPKELIDAVAANGG